MNKMFKKDLKGSLTCVFVLYIRDNYILVVSGNAQPLSISIQSVKMAE